MNEISNFKNLFSSQTDEVEKTPLTIQGQIPQWLEGSLFRTGPSLYEFGKTRLNHLFDGMAKFYKVSFSGSAQKAFFTSRFAQSKAYLKGIEKAALQSYEFGSGPKRTKLQTVLEALDFKATDNPNVNMFFLNQRFFACTETPFLTEFDPQNLNTMGQINLSDSIKSQISTAHPHFDFESGQLFNFLIEYGPVSTYKLISWKQGDNIPKQIASIKTDKPAYLHSFAITQNFVVLVLGPLVVNPLELLFSGKPFIQNFNWKPELGTKVFVIDKQGKKVTPFELPSFFVFHHINAYESGDRIEVDLLSYTDAGIVKDLYLETLCNSNKAPAVPVIKRLSIDLSSKKINQTILNEIGLELPTINYKNLSTKPYEHFFGIAENKKGSFLNQVVKISTNTAQTEAAWYEPDCYPSEAIFVNSKNSDSGVLVSIVTNVAENNAFCLILDSTDLKELCRIQLPHLIPFHFHGQFREGLL